MPPCASGPVLTVSRPILNGGLWAIAGAAIRNAAAPAAVPAKNARRLSLRDMVPPRLFAVHGLGLCPFGFLFLRPPSRRACDLETLYSAARDPSRGERTPRAAYQHVTPHVILHNC